MVSIMCTSYVISVFKNFTVTYHKVQRTAAGGTYRKGFHQIFTFGCPTPCCVDVMSHRDSFRF